MWLTTVWTRFIGVFNLTVLNKTEEHLVECMLFSLVGSMAKHKIKSKQKNKKGFVVPWTWTKDLLGNWVDGEGFLGMGGVVELPLNRFCTSVINKASHLQLRLHTT